MELENVIVRQERSTDWTAHWCGVLSHTHTYSGKGDHGGTVKPPESYRNLAAWARRLGIGAVAMGSPYTPKSAETYGRYDESERDAYYRTGFDQRSVLDADELKSMIAEVSEYADGTLFYLDNETPKGRFGHMWWLGHYPDMPAWHDYDQPYDRWMLNETRAGDHGDEPVAYERRAYLEVLAIQRAHGALGFWAHPTSWWKGEAGQFVTNIATEMPVHAMAQGYLDGMVIMGYQPYRPQYLELWFAMLDRGYRIPGVAEMDCGLSDAALWRRDSALLSYVPKPEEGVSTHELVKAFRAGRIFASSGPMIDISVDGYEMGQVVRSSSHMSHKVCLTAMARPGQAPLGRIELVGRGGEVLWSQDDFAGGTVELSIPGIDHRGYLVARVFGSEAGPHDWRHVKNFAITNPVYLHAAGHEFERPMTTNVKLIIRPDSVFHGGEVRFESTSGELLGTARASGTIIETLPACGRLTLVGPDGERRMEYLVNANRAVQDVQRYLYRGRFTLDFPEVRSGEVPPEAWRLDEYAKSLRHAELTY